MSEFERFMKQNKAANTDVEIPVTESLTDENGQPLLWKVRHLSTDEVERIRKECTYEKQVTGKYNQVAEMFNEELFSEKIMCEAIVYPDLRNAELQDSYGVTDPGSLLRAMVDKPGEYLRLQNEITTMNGFGESFDEKATKVKNS